jgi:GNAT superfamily N-acetyltransferase
MKIKIIKMRYSFISKDKLKYLYENKLIPTGYMAYNHSWENEEVKEIYSYVCYSAENIDKIFGLCVGVVYERNTIARCSQWGFGENRNRELWIEHIHADPNSQCKGSFLLKKVEEKLKHHREYVKRKNIYFVSIFEAVNFYEKCGYNEIYTKETDEDDDYPSSYVNGACVGTWMAKPLYEKLDSEEVSQFIPEYLFADSNRRHSVKMLQEHLTLELEVDIFWFLFPSDFKKFKNNCGRKYIKYEEEDFVKEKYPKYSKFLKSMEKYEKYEKTGDVSEVKPFFKEKSEKEIREILENYLGVK